MRSLIFLLILLLILSFGCNTEEHQSKEKVASLYVDLLIADESYKHEKDSLRFFTDSLYRHYNISQDDYKSELEKFQFDESTWDDFFRLAEKYLDSLKAVNDSSATEIDSTKSALKDSVKIYNIISKNGGK